VSKALSSNMRRVDTAVVVALHGDLDIGSVDRAKVALDDAEKLRPATLVLDLRGLTFFDSTGLRLLIKTASRATIDGRRMVVTAGGSTRQLIDTIRADKLFEVAESPEQVLGSAAT
jgi:anti-sigma B factor antagonist